jgi:hypothetical protein
MGGDLLMGFRLEDSVVEAFLFKRRKEGYNGKWSYTVELDMSDFYDEPTPIHAVENAWAAGKVRGTVHGGRTNRIPESWEEIRNSDGYWLVVPEPYHRAPYPVMVAV